MLSLPINHAIILLLLHTGFGRIHCSDPSPPCKQLHLYPEMFYPTPRSLSPFHHLCIHFQCFFLLFAGFYWYSITCTLQRATRMDSNFCYERFAYHDCSKPGNSPDIHQPHYSMQSSTHHISWMLGTKSILLEAEQTPFCLNSCISQQYSAWHTETFCLL